MTPRRNPGPMTGGEFSAELARDPEYQPRFAAAEADRQPGRFVVVPLALAVETDVPAPSFAWCPGR
jgi:hypothetical protein